MSIDIREQIKEMAEFHKSNREPVELEEVEQLVGRASKSMPRRTLPGPALAVAVMAAVLVLFGGVALVISTTRETPPADPVTPTTLVVPTTVPSTPSTNPEDDSNLGDLDLVWQRVEMNQQFDLSEGSLATILDGGNKFILVRQASDNLARVLKSADGSNWLTISVEEEVGGAHTAAAWEDTVLLAAGGGGWSREENGPVFWSPSMVSVIHPDGSVNRHVFDGDVQSAAVGPTGMFVTLLPHASYGVVLDEILGDGFSNTLYQAEVRDGVLFVTRDEPNRETFEIVLSEHGLTEDDLNSPVANWYSESGSDWIPVSDTPSGLSVVGTSDGFVGLAGTTAWGSEDGREWKRLGDLPFAPQAWQFSQLPMRWRQGAVATDLYSYAYISADGIELLSDPPLTPSSLDNSPLPLYLSGDLGLVVVNPVEKELLWTPDGENWKVGNLPDEMTDSFGWYTSSGAVTSEAVLLLLWEEETPGGAQRPVWWLGTLSDE
jgi:hypothetical protein